MRRIASMDWMTLDEVKKYLRCSHSAIYNGIKAGLLPKQYKIGGISRWNRDEIDEHIKKKCKDKALKVKK
jgi:excisionase family DNA binding protein